MIRACSADQVLPAQLPVNFRVAVGETGATVVYLVFVDVCGGDGVARVADHRLCRC